MSSRLLGTCTYLARRCQKLQKQREQFACDCARKQQAGVNKQDLAREPGADPFLFRSED